MNIKEYIESGVLEAYILGALSEDEKTLVEANIAKFPQLNDELLAIEAAMQQYSAANAKQPPIDLEDKIWKAIEQSSANADTQALQAARKIPFQPEYRKPAQWKYAALWIGLIGSLAANVFFWSQNNKTSQDKVALNTRVDKLQAEQRQLADLVGAYQNTKAMMSDTGMQTIVMHTMQKGHPMAATLYWSREKGDAYVSVDGLPAPPSGMQYQLWVMQGGKPVDMGVLPNNMANTPAIKKVNMRVMSGEAFAISLEKQGGSPTPTMQNIYVMGKV